MREGVRHLLIRLCAWASVCSEGSVNACTCIPVKLKHHHLDDLIAFIQYFIALFGVVPGLFKADIDAAFRRIPLFPEHRWAATIMYSAHDVVRGLPVAS